MRTFIKSAILATMFISLSPLQAIIYTISATAKKFADETNQTIWLLGDSHEYPRDLDYPAILECTTNMQRDDIIAMAKELDALVLAEDPLQYTPSYPIAGIITTHDVAAMQQEIADYQNQLLLNITQQCHTQGIAAQSIECRQPLTLLFSENYATKKPIVIAKNSLTAILYALPAAMIGSIFGILGLTKYVTDNLFFVRPNETIKAVAHNVVACTIYANQCLENSSLMHKAAHIHADSPIGEHIESLNEDLYDYENDPDLDWQSALLDIKVLNAIVQNPNRQHIMIVAGAWHIRNLELLLQELGYTNIACKQAYAYAKEIPINHEDSVRPTDIAQTLRKACKQNSLILA